MIKKWLLLTALLTSSVCFSSEDMLNRPIAREEGYPAIVRNSFHAWDAWGMSCSINLQGCKPLSKSKDSEKKIHSFSHRLVHILNMVPYGCPRIVWFGSGKSAGYTMVQLIETSGIIAHFAQSNIYLDVFSCEPYDPNLVASFAAAWFQADNWSVVTSLR